MIGHTCKLIIDTRFEPCLVKIVSEREREDIRGHLTAVEVVDMVVVLSVRNRHEQALETPFMRVKF